MDTHDPPRGNHKPEDDGAPEGGRPFKPEILARMTDEGIGFDQDQMDAYRAAHDGLTPIEFMAKHNPILAAILARRSGKK